MYLFIKKLRSFACARSSLPLIILIILLSMPASFAGATDMPASAKSAVTLNELLSEGLANNPSIKKERLNQARVEQRYPQAVSLDDPTVTYTQPIKEIETRLGPNKRSIKLTQKFPFPGKLRAKGRIANKEVELARLALSKAKRETIAEIKKSFYELYYIDEALVLTKERVKVFNHFTKAEMNDYSVGTTGLSDVVSAETRKADAEFDLILLTELREVEVTKLNTLIGRTSEAPLKAIAKPPITPINNTESDIKWLYARSDDNELIKKTALDIEKNELKEKLSGYTGKPNFMLGVNYTEIGEPVMAGMKDGGRDAVAVSLGLSIPIWAGKNRAARKEAQFARITSEQTRVVVKEKLTRDIKKAYSKMRSNHKLSILYSESLIPKAEKLISTVEINYKNGNGSIADLFEARAMWIDFRRAYFRAASNYLKNRAELEKLTAGYALNKVTKNE